MISIHKETNKLALHVIIGAAYGQSFDWKANEKPPPGHTMSLVEAIRVLINNHLLLLFIFPRWTLNLPFKPFTQTKMVYEEFGRHIQGLIDAEKSGGTTSNNSVLKLLVEYSAENPDKEGKAILSDEELIGNAFVIMMGGHESTYPPRRFVINLLVRIR